MTELTASAPDLTGRIARCAYFGSRTNRRSWRGDCPGGKRQDDELCRCEEPSSPSLAFFEYRGPGSKSVDLCKCGMTKKAHGPAWEVTLHITRRWFKIEKHVQQLAKTTIQEDEAAARAWAEQEAAAWRGGAHSSPETTVYDVQIADVRRTQSHVKCRTYTPRGPLHDEFYCGCKGWD